MITTKGIIEAVEIKGGIAQYRVRMPLFHETKTSSNITTNQLPLAIYPLPPHMESTILRVGDVVMCSLEDGGLDTVVIHGLIPKSIIPNTNGSDSTESEISVDKVNSVSFDIANGSVELPYKIKIAADENAKEILEGREKNYVDGKDLSYIRGLDAPLVETISKIKEVLDYLESTLIRPEVRVEVIEEGKS